jgi:transcriptional regulator with GAF, ATPase, and Fis domain
VLLDEIGDLPLELQGKLLRALEARQIYRVGGVAPIAIEARIIAATHHDLTTAIESGDFRRDLYFRLNGITLAVPPLRERRGDIAVLAAEFLGNSGHLSPAAHAALLAHDWPGNVRELRHVLDRAALLAGDGPIQPSHLLLSPARAAGDSVDREQFLALARQHHGNSAAIARALSTSRTQVRRLAARFGVDLDALRK